ncbi:MAG TPA: PilZ domain-containing protein [Vicinamibacteria bacterium]|nr:PilZ domain-containing protein [Vicinamibacteria bacterium]
MGAPRVLIVASRDLTSHLGDTLLWRSDIERVFSPSPEAALETLPTLGARLVVVDTESANGALRFVESLRRDPLTRRVSVAVLGHTLTVEDEDALRVAGANLVLSGRVEPKVWDGRLDELLRVPRRREVRVPVLCEAWTSIGHEPPVEGWALNLSVRGALLEMDFPLDLGTSIALTLHLPGEGAEIKCVARVVREAGGSEGRFWTGVEFLILRGDGRERIHRLIDGEPHP